MRAPGAVPNLCKADSGLSAMIGILVAISSHLVARYEDTFLQLYTVPYVPTGNVFQLLQLLRRPL